MGDNNGNTTTTSTSRIWSPPPGTTWQWQLTDYPVDTTLDVSMYDVDLFDTPIETLTQLHERSAVVICYFSAGSYEEWRPDAQEYTAQDYGNPLEGWEGEYWVDTRSENVRRILQARLDLAVEKGCDGVEPDNVDGYANDPGFPLDFQTQLDFNLFLSQEARARGLSIGLKNDLDQIAELLPHFDWALNEECLSYSECPLLRPFLEAQKAVFHVEYFDSTAQASTSAQAICDRLERKGFSTLLKLWDLNAWHLACPPLP
ncbi:MAG: endo alpha-1,4 polygalactosaminidase [Sorangium cellulosum]|nr:MAG: endo alpha-1,4 polygalactosaminidase [Sorangium cellulosum]